MGRRRARAGAGCLCLVWCRGLGKHVAPTAGSTGLICTGLLSLADGFSLATG